MPCLTFQGVYGSSAVVHSATTGPSAQTGSTHGAPSVLVLRQAFSKSPEQPISGKHPGLPLLYHCVHCGGGAVGDAVGGAVRDAPWRQQNSRQPAELRVRAHPRILVVRLRTPIPSIEEIASGWCDTGIRIRNRSRSSILWLHGGHRAPQAGADEHRHCHTSCRKRREMRK